MTKKRHIYPYIIVLLMCLVQSAGIVMYGQDSPRAANKRLNKQVTDTIGKLYPTPILRLDSIQHDSIVLITDSIEADNNRKMDEMNERASLEVSPTPVDSLETTIPKRTWVPDPTKATWLALIVPGGGQIYNKKYWKLPIIYGGFAGCAYALTWNGNMYKDYSNAYREAVNENWNSNYITDLLPPGYINRVSKTQLTETLRKRKDTYRRYRDLSIFAFIGVYLISVVDAYIDAELSNFDITPDLSMRVEPVVMDHHGFSNRKDVGVQCSFTF